MKSRTCVCLCSVVALFLLGTVAAGTAQATNGREILGSYKISDKAEAGSQVRVTLQIRLINQGDTDLSIKSVNLKTFGPASSGSSASSGSGSTPAATAVEIAAHGHANITQEFVVSRTEYEQMQKGLRLRIAVTSQAPDGQETSRVVELMRVDAMGAE